MATAMPPTNRIAVTKPRSVASDPPVPSRPKFRPEHEQQECDDERQDRVARAPDEHERVLLVAVRDPLPRRQQPIGVTHSADASLSGPRMGPAVHVPDPLTGEMRVELRGGDTRMPEQLLDDAQVRSALEQVGRERVPQRVRADTIGESRA